MLGYRFLLSSAAIAILATTAAHAQFTIDVDNEELRRATSRPAVTDLVVGEIGLLSTPRICEMEKGLFVYALTGLAQSREDYTANFEIQRGAGGGFDVKISMGPQASTPLVEYMQRLFLNVPQCRYLTNTRSELFPILKVNGYSSLSAMVASNFQ